MTLTNPSLAVVSINSWLEISPCLAFLQLSKNWLRGDVICLSECFKCSHRFLENGAARSPSGMKSLPFEDSSISDAAHANLYVAAFRPIITMARQHDSLVGVGSMKGSCIG